MQPSKVSLLDLIHALRGDAASRDQLAGATTELLYRCGMIALIVLAAVAVYGFCRRLIARIETAVVNLESTPEQRRRASTVATIALNVVRYVVIFWAVVGVLKQCGVNPTPILASAGVIGLAVAFGAQSLVKDVVSGFFIMVEGQFSVGDMVEINSIFGVVEEVGLRMTKLRDATGQLRYFSNGLITATNRYTEGGVPYRVTVPTAADHAEQARGVVANSFADFGQLYNCLFGTPVELPSTILHNGVVILRYVAAAIPTRQAVLEAKLTPYIVSALQQAGIEIPEAHEVVVAGDSASFNQALTLAERHPADQPVPGSRTAIDDECTHA